MTAQAPVAPGRLSMSFIRSAEGCLRRAEMERHVDTASEDAVIGRVFHEVAAAVGFACSMRGAWRPERAEAERIARKVMSEPEEVAPLPKAAWDTVLGWVRWWADRAEFRPGEQFEVDSRIELAGRVLSARLDRLAIDGTVAYVRDYKSGWADPAKGLTVQGEVYGWHVLRREPAVELVVYEEEHIRARVNGGPWKITRQDAASTEEFLLAAIARIDRAYESGDLPATPGSACSSPTRCPVAGSCPVPRWATSPIAIESREDAIAEFEQVLVGEAQLAERKQLIRGWLEHTGERALQLHGEEIGWAAKPGRSLDQQKLKADLAAGVGIDLDSYRKPTNPSFGRRKAVDA